MTVAKEGGRLQPCNASLATVVDQFIGQVTISCKQCLQALKGAEKPQRLVLWLEEREENTTLLSVIKEKLMVTLSFPLA